MNLSRKNKEKIIENFLYDYNTYRVGIQNCKNQLDYIIPSLVVRPPESEFYIPNDTANVAVERIEGNLATDLQNKIEFFTLVVESINRAVNELPEKLSQFVHMRYFKGYNMAKIIGEMNYVDEKSAYRIRREVLDKFLISLSNLIWLK